MAGFFKALKKVHTEKTLVFSTRILYTNEQFIAIIF